MLPRVFHALKANNTICDPLNINVSFKFFSYFIKRLYSPVGPRKPFPILWGAAGPIQRPISSSRAPPACQADERAGWGLDPAAEWDSIWSPAPAPRSACDLTPAGGET